MRTRCLKIKVLCADVKCMQIADNSCQFSTLPTTAITAGMVKKEKGGGASFEHNQYNEMNPALEPVTLSLHFATSVRQHALTIR